MKKKMGLGRIMEDKKMISVIRIMEDLDKQKKIMVFQRNYGWWKKNNLCETNNGRLVKQKKNDGISKEL